MIDFNNGTLIKLSKTDLSEAEKTILPLLVTNEKCLVAYKSFRDFVIFTDSRIIAINVQGATGKKKDFTSMPYSKINVFSVETAGVLDTDTELELYFSGLGKVKFEFSDYVDILSIGRLISAYAIGDVNSQNEIINDFLSPELKLQTEVGYNEWKCPNCGRVNQNYVGTCGCGTKKP